VRLDIVDRGTDRAQGLSVSGSVSRPRLGSKVRDHPHDSQSQRGAAMAGLFGIRVRCSMLDFSVCPQLGHSRGATSSGYPNFGANALPFSSQGAFVLAREPRAPPPAIAPQGRGQRDRSPSDTQDGRRQRLSGITHRRVILVSPLRLMLLMAWFSAPLG
jgi:hypothetical protein